VPVRSTNTVTEPDAVRPYRTSPGSRVSVTGVFATVRNPAPDVTLALPR
jgi:hypothetical protein